MKNTNQRLEINCSDKQYFLEHHQIICIRADHSQSHIFLMPHDVLPKEILACKSLSYLEELLPTKKFVRTHNSWIVNLQYTHTLAKNEGADLILDNGQKVPVARERKEAVITAMRH